MCFFISNSSNQAVIGYAYSRRKDTKKGGAVEKINITWYDYNKDQGLIK